jgi:hypothetical protein
MDIEGDGSGRKPLIAVACGVMFVKSFESVDEIFVRDGDGFWEACGAGSEDDVGEIVRGSRSRFSGGAFAVGGDKCQMEGGALKQVRVRDEEFGVCLAKQFGTASGRMSNVEGEVSSAGFQDGEERDE